MSGHGSCWVLCSKESVRETNLNSIITRTSVMELTYLIAIDGVTLTMTKTTIANLWVSNMLIMMSSRSRYFLK